MQDGGETVSYLPNDGQRLTNPMNRYMQAAGRTLSYDLKGNLTGDGVNTYTYDALNRQVAMSGAGGMSAEYVYDALGQRVAKIVNGAATYYIYDLDEQVIEERDAAGQLLARYTYGAMLDAVLTMERGGNVYIYHHDALGNVTEVTDDSGALVERYEYDVYGTARIFDGSGSPLATSAIGNDYLFTGRQYDGESGNYYYRARMYSPRLGRFLQMDPLGYVDGMNLYMYVRNNPALYTDPSGMVCGTPGKEENIVPDYVEFLQVENGQESWIRMNFSPACARHDLCYMQCGVARSACDKQFYENLESLCVNYLGGGWVTNHYALSDCLAVASLYYRAVHTLGGNYYYKDQRRMKQPNGCPCIPPRHLVVSLPIVVLPRFGERDTDDNGCPCTYNTTERPLTLDEDDPRLRQLPDTRWADYEANVWAKLVRFGENGLVKYIFGGGVRAVFPRPTSPER